MFKNWFLLASVSCGVGFGSTFLISRNLQQSTLAGLGTVPAVAASLTILSRQRREEIDRQVAKSRLGLNHARQQEQLFKEEIELQVTQSRVGLDEAQKQEQLFKDRCREISAHGKKLQTEFTQLQQAVNQDRERKTELEREINSLALQKQEQLAQVQAQNKLEIDSAQKLDIKLRNLRDKLVEKGADLSSIESQISQMEERRNQVSIAITNLDILLDQKKSLRQDTARQEQSLLQQTNQQKKQSLQQEISDLLLQKQDQRILLDQLVINISTKENNLVELDNEISARQVDLDRIGIHLDRIEARKQSAIDSAQTSELALANIQEEIRQDSAVKGELKLEITDLQNQERSLQTEVAAQSIYRTEIQQQISALAQQQEIISTSVNNLNQSRENQQSLLDDLNLKIWNQQQCQANICSEITELENSISLFSVHITGQALNIGIADLYRRWQEVSQQVSQLEEQKNQPSIIATNPVIEPEPSIIAEEWKSRLTNNPYLPVFQHIDRWGSITESERNNILGDPQIGRKFNREFREYYQYLPFSIRVETSNNSIRYVKEIITVFTPQNPLYLPQPEIVNRHTETDQYISEPEDNIIQDLNSNDESQSDDYLAEKMIHKYPVCLFCERPPMPGQDRCKDCN
jgi:chromosome segregation ATPase